MLPLPDVVHMMHLQVVALLWEQRGSTRVSDWWAQTHSGPPLVLTYQKI